jgi:hypothetical protein
MTALFIIVIAIIGFIIAGSFSKTVKVQSTNYSGLNEMGVKLVKDLELHHENGGFINFTNEYLSNFGVLVDKITLNNIYNQILITESPKTEEYIRNLVITLSGRKYAEDKQYICQTEDEVNDINLEKGELLVKNWFVEWKEEKTITTGVTYGGVRMSGKGPFKSVFGSMNIVKHTKTDFMTVDFGMVYLTSKRIIFTGKNNKNRTIRLNKVLDVEFFQDGLFIRKENGTSPMITNGTPERNEAPEIARYISRIVFDDVELVTK